jgi:hypothetical protein
VPRGATALITKVAWALALAHCREERERREEREERAAPSAGGGGEATCHSSDSGKSATKRERERESERERERAREICGVGAAISERENESESESQSESERERREKEGAREVRETTSCGVGAGISAQRVAEEWLYPAACASVNNAMARQGSGMTDESRRCPAQHLGSASGGSAWVQVARSVREVLKGEISRGLLLDMASAGGVAEACVLQGWVSGAFVATLARRYSVSLLY